MASLAIFCLATIHPLQWGEGVRGLYGDYIYPLFVMSGSRAGVNACFPVPLSRVLRLVSIGSTKVIFKYVRQASPLSIRVILLGIKK